MTRSGTLASRVLIAVAVTTISARASAPIDPKLSGTETLFGTGNVDGVSGNGAMAAGFSPEGELTLLRWPSPSYFDQVSYLTPPFPETDTTALRASPRNGAPVNAGVFTGLALRTTFGGRVTWLRDGDWRHEQRYLGPDSVVVVTASTEPALGLTATQLDFVLPNDESFREPGARRDSVLVRHLTLTRTADSPVTEARLVHFENLAPCTVKVPFAPVTDSDLDLLNDFALVYSARRDALLHFRPSRADPSRLAAEAHDTRAEVDDLVERLDQVFQPSTDPKQPGVYAALATDTPSAGHQCGRQLRPQRDPLQDAFADANDDGTLTGTSFVQGLASGALASTPLRFDSHGNAEATLYVALAGRAADALSLLDAVRAKPFAEHLDRTERWWSELMHEARVPVPDLASADDDAKLVAVAKRALINLFIALDEVTGAVVASITTQPPYAEDWPRDGSFINEALDLAGFPELVRHRNLDFYAPLARPAGELDYRWLHPGPHLDLAGTWAMNYYADGTPSGPLLFEIDETGLMVWNLYRHYQHTHDLDYLRQAFPAIAAAATTLARCRDATNGLQCFAEEDDTLPFTQGPEGATAVYAALRSAIAAADTLAAAGFLDLASDPRPAWRERRDELERAMRDAFYVAEPSDGSPPHFRSGGLTDFLWPCEFPMSDAERAAEEQYLFDGVVPHLLRETDGASYLPRTTATLAFLGWTGVATAHPEIDIREAQRILMTQVPTPGTNQYGEVFVTRDTDGDGVRDFFDNRTAIPQVWTGVLDYIAAMYLFPPAESAPPSGTRHGGGGCDVAGTGASAPVAASAVLLAALVRALRRARRMVA